MSGYNFSERVRKVLAMAREEATRLHHEYVGTEHILLGLIREDGGVAAIVLHNLGVDFHRTRQRIEETAKEGEAGDITGSDLPYTSRAKKVLVLAMGDASLLHHSYVGTEHLLLALIQEEEGLAGQVLTDSGLTFNAAREETLRILSTEIQRGGPHYAREDKPSAGQTLTPNGEQPTSRLANSRYLMSLAGSLLLWWLLGLWIAWSYHYIEREGVASILVTGALIGAILGALHWVVNEYRLQHKLTWIELFGRAILIVLASGLLVRLYHTDQNDWDHIGAVLLVIGFYAAYVAGGLLVLYLAVRVVRAAWRR